MPAVVPSNLHAVGSTDHSSPLTPSSARGVLHPSSRQSLGGYLAEHCCMFAHHITLLSPTQPCNIASSSLPVCNAIHGLFTGDLAVKAMVMEVQTIMACFRFVIRQKTILSSHFQDFLSRYYTITRDDALDKLQHEADGATVLPINRYTSPHQDSMFFVSKPTT